MPKNEAGHFSGHSPEEGQKSPSERLPPGEENSAEVLRDQKLKRQISGLEPRVRRYIFSRTHNHAAAEDLIQETMLVAIAKIKQLRDPEKLRGWVFAIAKNVLNAYYRAQGEEGRVIDRHPGRNANLADSTQEEDENFLENLPDPKAGEAQTLAGIVEQREQKSLQEAFERLPSKSREVLNMRYAQNLSYKEMANALNIPPDMIKTLLYRARQQLGEKLGVGDAEIRINKKRAVKP